MTTFKIGDIIVFTNEIVKDECDGSPGIKARIIGLEICADDEDMTKVTFDVSEFVSYNKHKWEANYFDNAHKPTLTYPETKYYDPKFSYYFMNDDVESGEFFKLAESEIKVDLEFVVKHLRELHTIHKSNFGNLDKLSVIESLMNDFGIKV